MGSSPWSERHRRGLLFTALLLVIGGAVALFQLPVSLFPHTTFPRIEVSADAGDRPAERMVVEVTRPLEEAVRSVPGVLRVRSNTSRGSADISIDLRWGVDMVAATLQVESAVNQAASGLPSGFSFEVRRMDPTVFPVMGLSLSSPTEGQVALRDLALYELRPLLSSVDGVASVRVLGGREEEYQVLLDPVKLEAVGLGLADVVGAVSAAHTVQAVGRLEQDEKLYLVLGDTRFQGIEDVGQVVVRQDAAGLLRLRDLGQIVDGTRPAWTRAEADGQEAVLVNVYQQPDGNTVRISSDIHERLDRFHAMAPADVKLSTWYDQSQLIAASAASVRDSILVGVVLAVLVLVVFLRSWRVTLVVVLAVPSVLLATALVLLVSGASLNIMTLGGMAAAVGLIIDDAIVVVEHVVRRAHESERWERRRAYRSAAEMGVALTGSSLATIVIFVPLAWLSGVTGAFFAALSITMASALVISYLFAAAVVPALSAWLLRPSALGQRADGRWLRWVLVRYERLLRLLLARPALSLLGVLPLLVVGVIAFRGVGSGFMPVMDEGGFILDYRAPAGTSLAETDRRLRVLEGLLDEVPEIETWSRRTGLQLGGHISEANEGDYFIRLVGPPRRPIDEVMDEVRAKVQARVPGVEIELAQLMEDLIGDLTAVPQPIEVKLYGSDEVALRAWAERVATAVAQVPDTVDVLSGVVLAGDAVDIQVDRVRARSLGLDPETITRLARLALEGEVATQVQQGEKMVGVRVWTAPSARADLDLIRAMRLQTPDGHSVALGRVATFQPVTGQPQIVREDLKTMVAVTGRISGRDLGSVMRDVRRAVTGVHLPPAITVSYGGLYAQQRQSFRGLLVVLGAAVALLFVLLLFLYQRFAAPVAILGTSLLSLAAVFVGLWWTGSELDIASMMGLTMIVGIASEAAIFFLTRWQEAAQGGDPVEALVVAGRDRARPILMTAIAAMLALLPLALGIGEGAEMLRPLAIAIIAGLLAAIPLVLLVLPVLFSLLSRART